MTRARLEELYEHSTCARGMVADFLGVELFNLGGSLTEGPGCMYLDQVGDSLLKLLRMMSVPILAPAILL